VRHAYMAGPGRAIDFLLSASDLHEFAARLPYASSSLAFGTVDASDITARRRALDDVLREAESAQRSYATAQTRLTRLRGSIERRLAAAETSARNDATALDEVRSERKRYAGTLDRVAGATRSIRRKRGEALYAAAERFLGPRKDCSIPRGLSSTGDRIAGEASWYGEEFRGQPTASGAWYIPERFTVAHRTLPFGLFLLIRFRDRCVVAFLNDRGPYVDGRILDLSGGSARAVGLTGVQQVSATLLVRAR
jgi:peptidoglycan lytic transglycosylase